MSPTPTGRLFGNDLVLTRTFHAPVADVWASLTDPERTARWFGPWKGDAAPGRTIQVQMVQEESQPWMDMTIDACEPRAGWHCPPYTITAAGTWTWSWPRAAV